MPTLWSRDTVSSSQPEGSGFSSGLSTVPQVDGILRHYCSGIPPLFKRLAFF